MDIPRSEQPWTALAVLPVLTMPLLTAKGDGLMLVSAIAIGVMTILVAVLLNYGLYLRKTPLVRIDETALVFFGDNRSQQRSFQRHAISSISLTRRPLFWRSSYRLSVVENGQTVNLWIQRKARNSVSKLAQALREEFPDKFVEVSP